MSNPSARNSKPKRSVTLNILLAAKSVFHAPGPVKVLRRVMVPGNGPRSEIPKSELRGSKLDGRGTDKELNRFGPTACGEAATFLFVTGVAGVRRGKVYPIKILFKSNTEKGVPCRALIMLEMVQPPSASRERRLPPLLNQGVSQIGATTSRLPTLKSEVPQSSPGFVKSVYPREPMYPEPPCVSDPKVVLKSSNKCDQV